MTLEPIGNVVPASHQVSDGGQPDSQDASNVVQLRSPTIFSDVKVSILGSGNMGCALAGAILDKAKPVFLSENVTVVGRSSDKAMNVAAELGCIGVNSDYSSIAESNVIVLACKPQDLEALIIVIKDSIRSDALVISLAAGKSISWLREQIGSNGTLACVMPNMAFSLGRSATLYQLEPESRGTANEVILRAILNAGGEFFEVTAAQAAAATTLAGCGPAIFAAMVEYVVSSPSNSSLPHDMAEALAISALQGTAALLTDRGMSPSEVIARIATKGGVTAKILETLRDREVGDSMAAALQAGVDRIQKL